MDKETRSGVFWGLVIGVAVALLICAGACALVGCHPIDDAASAGREQCQQVIDEQVLGDGGIVEQLTTLCEDQASAAADACRETIGQAIDDVEAWALQAIADAERDGFLRAGCTETPDAGIGWDCRASTLCQ